MHRKPFVTRESPQPGWHTSYLDVRSASSEHVVVLHELAEFREVPAIPLPNTHSERVEVFVELVQQADALDDHVVRARRVHFDLPIEKSNKLRRALFNCTLLLSDAWETAHTGVDSEMETTRRETRGLLRSK